MATALAGALRDVVLVASLLIAIVGLVALLVLTAVLRRVRRHEAAARAAADSAERIQRYLDAARVFLVALDAEGRIRFANERAASLVGWAPRDMVGRDCFGTFVPAPLGARLRTVFEEVVRGEAELLEYFETPVVDGDGSERTVAWRIVILRDGDTVDGVLCSGEDITERKRLEDEVAAHRTRLEEQVAQRTRELERSNRDLEEFAALASHDLQAPLVAIVGFLELLRDQEERPLGPREAGYVEASIEAARRLQGMVRGLLAYARVGASGRAKEPVDLAAVLEEAWADLGPVVARTEARLDHAAMPEVPGDPVQLRQLFLNLFGNALKYRGGAPPRIEATAQALERGWRIDVADNGIGIDEHGMADMFGMFRRLPAAQGIEGSGVGLAVCKRIVERHGGAIEALPREGGGTVVRFTLAGTSSHVALPPPPASGATTGPPAGLAGPSPGRSAGVPSRGPKKSL